MSEDYKIGVIGLGYVGLPLAVAFSSKYTTVGFDIDSNRISVLQTGVDYTLEVAEKQLNTAFSNGFSVSCELEDIASCNVYIVTVPTPIDDYCKPDFTPLLAASRSVAKVLKKEDIVIFESTVYPGATEEICVPELETSGLIFNQDFYVGYSPERINPGDKERTVEKIIKVTSGSTPEKAQEIDRLYASIIDAGTHLAPSIKVAEAAKVIENAQRDINIAFVNELSRIFRILDIDTKAVLAAAGTKWNFLKFTPGLVGGHCIGVDPYYLAEKAQEVGYNPEIILTGRRLNDSMGGYIAQETVKLMVEKEIPIKASKVLILGITFKENCPDIRNSRVIDIYEELKTFNTDIAVYDPNADALEVKESYGIELISELSANYYDAIIVAVAHKQFVQMDVRRLVKDKAVIFDVKGLYPQDKVDARL